MTLDMIQRRRNLVPSLPSSCSPFWPRSGEGPRRRRLCRAFRRPKIALFTWSTSSSAELQALYQVRDRQFFGRPNDIRLHKPHETNESTNAFRAQGRAFSFPRYPDLRIHKNRTREFEKSPRRAAASAEPGRLQIPYALPFMSAFQANRGRLRRSIFTGSGRNRPGSRIELPPRSLRPRGHTRYGPPGAPAPGRNKDILRRLGPCRNCSRR